MQMRRAGRPLAAAVLIRQPGYSTFYSGAMEHPAQRSIADVLLAHRHGSGPNEPANTVLSSVGVHMAS
jgi:hypothetical protein